MAMTDKSKRDAIINSAAIKRALDPTAKRGSAREAYLKELATNPMFKEIKDLGLIFGIVGAKRQ